MSRVTRSLVFYSGGFQDWPKPKMVEWNSVLSQIGQEISHSFWLWKWSWWVDGHRQYHTHATSFKASDALLWGLVECSPADCRPPFPILYCCSQGLGNKKAREAGFSIPFLAPNGMMVPNPCSYFPYPQSSPVFWVHQCFASERHEGFPPKYCIIIARDLNQSLTNVRVLQSWKACFLKGSLHHTPQQNPLFSKATQRHQSLWASGKGISQPSPLGIFNSLWSLECCFIS